MSFDDRVKGANGIRPNFLKNRISIKWLLQLVPILVPSSELNNIIYNDIKINP